MQKIGLTKGSAPIKAIIAFAILAAVIYAAIVLVPIYADHYSLEDKIKEDIQFAPQRIGKQKEKMEKNFTNKIKGYLDQIGAVYEVENIVVRADTSRKQITARVTYQRPHSIPFFPKQFSIDVDAKYGLD